MKRLLTILALSLPAASHAEEAVLNSDIQAAFEAGKLDGLHSVLVLHRGEAIADVHFDGADEAWGKPLGIRQHGPETLHDLRSVTKSVVALLYGIALAEGKVPPLDATLLSLFPEYDDLDDDPLRAKITIDDTLAMRMGTEWNEDLPYSDPANSEIAMELAEDRYRYVLDRPMVREPGDWWTYNGGAVAIIGKLIADGTGMPLDEYAQAKLFEPLGIEEYEWARGSDGVPSGASGLRLSIRDLVKIGQLVVDGGVYDGVRVVPKDWLDKSFEPHSTLQTGLRYGYFWWLAGFGDPPGWVAGFGNGGQRLTIQPQHDLIIAIFAGRYNDAEAWQLPVAIIEEHVVPAVTKRIKAR